MDVLTGTCSGMESSEARLLRSRVSSANAAEPFLLRMPRAEERLDLWAAPLCSASEVHGLMLLTVLLEVPFTRLDLTRTGWCEGAEVPPG